MLFLFIDVLFSPIFRNVSHADEFECHKKNFQSSYRNGHDLNSSDKYYEKQNDEDDTEHEDLNVVDDSEENSNPDVPIKISDAGESREKYKKSILHRYLADSVEAVNTLKDNDINEDDITSKHTEAKLNDTSESIDDGKIDNSSSTHSRKRKRSTSSDDPSRKCIKTQNGEKSKPTTSRSLHSKDCHSNFNVTTSNALGCRRRNTQPVRNLLPLLNPR